MRPMLLGVVLPMFFAAAAAAQDSPSRPLWLEPYVGAFNDSYDISPDGHKTGVNAGLRLGYALDDRTRLLADVGYAHSEDVSNPQGLRNYFVYDNTWAITTVGAEYDVIAGRTSAALGLRVGAGWRRNDLAGKVGDPAPHTDWYSGHGFSPIDVVVPSLTLRRELLPGAALAATLQHHIFDVLEGPSGHSPSLVLGLSFR